jgi:hypothetical protein
MATLRRLKPKGIDAFRDYLRRVRAGAEFQDHPAILYVPEFSAPVTPPIAIELRRFDSKREAAAYLVDVLRPLDSPTLADDIGLWSWLALFFFDQLSPVGADGKRKPRQDYHFIPGGSGWTRERHLLAGPYKLFRRLGERARVLLYPPPHEHGSFVDQLMTRQELISNRGLIEAIDLLYWNERTQRPKRGATTESRPGSLRRFIAVMQQLDFNYDLYGMTAGELLDMLPAEFDGWRNPRRVEDLHPRGVRGILGDA